MLKGMLTTIVTVAFVLCGATVGLEALGLMFHVGTAGPEHRIEAAVAKIEANLDPMNVPREPEADALWPARQPPLADAAPTLQEELAASVAQATADAGQPTEPSTPATPSPLVMAAAAVDNGSAGTSEAAPAARPPAAQPSAQPSAQPPAQSAAAPVAAPEPVADDAAAAPSPAVAPAPAAVAAVTITTTTPPPAAPEPSSAAPIGQSGPTAAGRSRQARHRATREPATTMMQARSGPECPGCTWLEAVAGGHSAL